MSGAVATGAVVAGAAPIPAFVNPLAGSAAQASEALAAAGGAFAVQEMAPDALRDALREAVARGARRVVVAGGDGTIATAAGVLAGTGVELALLPGGTLNHFARDHGIPTDAAEAVQVAITGVARRVDVAEVNGELFLNTSAVGAYVVFVRTREQLERRMGYRLASLLAALRVLVTMRRFRVVLEVDGESRVYRTPLVFVGVGERELRVPVLGGRVEGGRRALHVLVVRSRTSTRALTLSLALAARGVRAVSRTAALDGFLVDACRIEMRRPIGYVALDGETRRLVAPLQYALRREALTVVVPQGEAAATS